MREQLPLLPLPDENDPHAYARRTDPHTSHAAAASLDAITLTTIQDQVKLLLCVFGPMTHVMLVELYREHYGKVGSSTIRTRCKELVDLGLVYDTGVRTLTHSHRQTIVWAARE